MALGYCTSRDQVLRFSGGRLLAVSVRSQVPAQDLNSQGVQGEYEWWEYCATDLRDFHPIPGCEGYLGVVCY